jgi:hypothetical protein
MCFNVTKGTDYTIVDVDNNDPSNHLVLRRDTEAAAIALVAAPPLVLGSSCSLLSQSSTYPNPATYAPSGLTQNQVTPASLTAQVGSCENVVSISLQETEMGSDEDGEQPNNRQNEQTPQADVTVIMIFF